MTVVLSVATGSATAVSSGTPLGPTLTIGASAKAPTPAAAESSSSGAGGGTLEVFVPPLPDLHALVGLCTAFLASRGRAGGTQTQLLMGATGGTVASTAKWCRTYLSLRR